MTTQTVVQSGPVPAPEILDGYDRLVPGSAERIIAMAEADQRHRIAMEREAQASDIAHRSELTALQTSNARSAFRSDLVGQGCGALIALTAVAGAIYTAAIGVHWAIPVALVSLPIGAIIKAVRERPPGKGDKK